jgi:hypothetical protein
MKYLGMRKDYILTPEQKQTKKRRLEENRLLRTGIIDHIKTENTNEPIIHYESVRTIEIPFKVNTRMICFLACKYSCEFINIAQSI